jgi:hypothetical protein
MATLEELKALADGWHGPKSKAITSAAIDTADNLTPVPCSDGGLQLELHAGGVDIEITIRPDGQVADVYFARASVVR